ncbi:uncharacterized protein K460DRAFT_373639 [Cucurbitaria berberidis CBS 394.84]|uniref:Zn(2)-C6 fungal-type domain-containing protein n=1 Tax=Cucurbitaria berberidis CBS 394.84 TaxID=1168544 RepID=A0A9P4GTU0_9PLEO|nr:uncharacterized protein K460DRAFT_373639 [Cucurbitaria berberidis CBS 394.84]KAF1851687.1 hypothetical protein K460DRAFT_373639 [Cucurbitaria berberidis CBS 394.84]
MLVEDMFDGWLAIPSITDFLTEEAPPDCHVPPEQATVTETPKHTTNEPARLWGLNVDDSPNQLLSTPGESTSTTSRVARQRRGHTKSRLGCVTCRKRKVKCQETWPSCANCMKRGVVCRYPAIFKYAQRDRIVSEALSPRQFVQLSDTPTMFSSDDMRLFHHYLISAYPGIPHDYEDIWTIDVPKYSHQNTYLMHAILALAGSHLALQVENPPVKLALTHRQKAIVGLEDAFTKWPPSAEDAHIMLATSYLLSFQSCCIEDGFMDNVLSLRGCAFLSQLICGHGLKGPFALRANMHSATMDLTFKNFPHLDQELACEALQSMRKFSHLLAEPTTHAIEKAVIAQLVETIRPLLERDPVATPDTTTTPGLSDTSTEVTTSCTSSEAHTTYTVPNDRVYFMNPLFPTDLTTSFDDIDWDTVTIPPSSNRDPLRSFNALMSTLVVFSTWPYDALVHLFSPTNQLGNVVLAHCCTVRVIISPLSAPKNAMRTPIRAMIEWAVKIVAAVEDDENVKWTEYVAWPKKILQCMQACVEKKKGSTFEDLYEMLLNDPGAFKEGRARRA